MRDSGTVNTGLMIAIPAAVAVGYMMVSTGGVRGFAAALEGFLRGLVAIVSSWTFG